MIRVRRAVPATPSTIAGSQMCLSRSTNLAEAPGRLSTYSGENRPVIISPKLEKANHIRIRASMKFGVATPT